MDYIVGMPRQTTNFLLSLGFGFCIGVLYDVVRTIRLIFGGGKRTVLIFDILYSAFAGLVTFIFSLVITNGMVFLYITLRSACLRCDFPSALPKPLKAFLLKFLRPLQLRF